VGGSGKQSLARLAAFTAGCGVFEVTLTRGYDEAAFRDDLKKLYGLLGSEDRRMVFLFTDSHVADEGFLELINNMLTTGAVGRVSFLVGVHVRACVGLTAMAGLSA
jgi:dynein heavy chain